MTREQAVKYCREELDVHEKLKDWHIRINAAKADVMGLCSFADKCIILGALHIDTHPDPEVLDTIKHEVAHALVGPEHNHDEVWKIQAIKLGARPEPCSTMGFSSEMIDAIRSGATIEVEFEEKLELVTKEEIVQKPKYQITRLQDRCATCNKVAKTKNEVLITNIDPFKPDQKFIYLECGHLIVKAIPKGTPFHLLVSNQEKVKDCKHEWLLNQCTICAEYKPFPFQVEGMQFVETALAVNKGAAIFDEMGLGKTIQALGYIKFHPESWPVLYIVKSKIKFQWFKQIIIWMGDAFVGQMISASNDSIIPGLRTYIVSYDMLVYKERKSKSGKTIKQGFDIRKFDGIIKTVVIDECQQIKNPDSSRTQQVRRVVKDAAVIALSGTPWKNRGSEFFSVLNMMAPMKFNSYQNYIETWVDHYYEGNKLKEGGIRNPARFKEYIKDIAIRREISDVQIEMPDVNRMRFDVQLDDLSQTTYDDEESDFVKWYNQFIIDGTEDEINGMHILAKLSRMRHITGLAKIEATKAYVEEFLEDTERKLTIYVHHIDVGQILYNNIKKDHGHEVEVFELVGGQTGIESFKIQEAFQNSKRAILIASTLSAGEGINLQSCSDAIMHERQWNPQNEDQAAPGRHRRIGSLAKIINVTFPTAEGTVDDILHGIVERKRANFHNGMNKGEVIKWDENSIAKELAEGILKRFKNKNKNKPVREDGKKFSELVKM